MRTFAPTPKSAGKPQTAPVAAARSVNPPSPFRAVRKVLRSPGHPLPQPARALVGPGFDLSRVRVHIDADAAASADALGARAYTVGTHIAFGPNQYAPGTSSGQALLAHELAHVLQQREVTSSPPRTLELGSPSHPAEREAEAFARSVLSPSPSLRETSPVPPVTPLLTSFGSHPILRRAPKAACAAESWAGCFTASGYVPALESDTTGPKRPYMGADIHIEFAPNEKVDASKIALVQTVQFLLDGKPSDIYFHEDESHEDGKAVDVPTPKIIGVAERYSTTDTGYPEGQKKKQTEVSRSIDALDTDAPGTKIDNLPANRSPLAGLKDPAKGGKLSDAGEQGENHFGFRYKDKGKLVGPVSAAMKDIPRFHVPVDAEAEQRFETAALAVEGAQAGAFYGSVQWGWKKAKSEISATLTKFQLLSKGAPSPVLERTAELWNTSRTTTDEPSIPLPIAHDMFTVPARVTLLDAPEKGKKVADLPAGTELQVTEKTDSTHKDWKDVVVTGGDSAGKAGWLQQDTLTDRAPATKPKRPGQR